MFSKEYTPSEFFDILIEYKEAVRNGIYKKTIPYDTWRELRRVNETVKIVISLTANIVVSVYKDSTCLYSEGVENDGFALFFYYEKFKYKEKSDMTMDDVSKVAIDGTVSTIKIEPSRLEPGTIILNTDNDWIVMDAKKSKTQEDLDNLNTRIDELVEELAEKADISNVDVLYNHTVQDRADITKLEIKTSENRSEINHIEDRIYNLNDCISVLTNGLSTTDANIYSLREEFDKFVRELEEKENKKKVKNKENNTMKNFNFDFGPCSNDNVRMSMYGLAVKNAAGTYVSLNPSTREVVDVDIFNFEGGKYLFKMPVAIKDIAVGDVIIHNKKPMFVEGFSTLGDIMAIDPVAGERKEVMLTKSPFMFNYATKIVNLFDGFTNGTSTTPSPENPFGNLLPMLMFNDNNSFDDNVMVMLAMMSMNNSNINNNPMLLYALTRDKNDDNKFDMLPFFLMNNMCQHNAPTVNN